MHNKKIIIIDDHAMFCSALSMLFRAELHGVDIISAGTLQEAMQVGGATLPDLVLLDIKLRG